MATATGVTTSGLYFRGRETAAVLGKRRGQAEREEERDRGGGRGRQEAIR